MKPEEVLARRAPEEAHPCKQVSVTEGLHELDLGTVRRCGGESLRTLKLQGGAQPNSAKPFMISTKGPKQERQRRSYNILRRKPGKDCLTMLVFIRGCTAAKPGASTADEPRGTTAEEPAASAADEPVVTEAAGEPGACEAADPKGASADDIARPLPS